LFAKASAGALVLFGALLLDTAVYNCVGFHTVAVRVWQHDMHVGCCHVLQVRDQLMDWLCEREMAVYQVRSGAGIGSATA
jgi:hypothetical protein